MLSGFGATKRQKLTRAQYELMTDQELVADTLRGNTRAYEALVRRYQKLVYNVAYQLLQNHESAADVTQDTFVKALKNLSTFRADGSFKPWILRIASNTGLNKIRDEKHRQHDSLDEVLDDKTAAEPVSAHDVEREVEWKLSQAILVDALRQLPPRSRHIFVLRYQHDLSYAEIAMIAEETESAIKAVLFRTRERLRKLLEEQMKK